MSFRDQQKYLDVLKRHERKFDAKEAADFKMFIKRHKDEEDFDTVSLRKLKELYDKYNVSPKKEDYDKFFKKKEEE